MKLVSIKELYYDARPTKSQERYGTLRVTKRWAVILEFHLFLTSALNKGER